MKIISSKAHGIIDYLLVLFLLSAPTIFQMHDKLCTITYAIAVVHLCVVLLTDFELGAIKLIPFRIHGMLEIVVALAFAGLAMWFNSMGNDLGFYFYAILAAVVLIVFILTDFTGRRAIK